VFAQRFDDAAREVGVTARFVGEDIEDAVLAVAEAKSEPCNGAGFRVNDGSRAHEQVL
jgi:hypothetical protein